MKPFSRLWFCLWLLIVPVAARAQYTITTNADGVSCTITGYTGISGRLVIPSTIDGLTVVRIGDSALAGSVVVNGLLAINYPNAVPTSVVIPDTVTNIGNAAFYDCSHLTNAVVWGNLGSDAFGECASLATVTILGNATVINECAFDECHSLVSVGIPQGVTSIETDFSTGFARHKHDPH